MKLRWVVLIIAIVIAVYMGINVVAEMSYLDTVVSEINRTMITASEQAINQVLASDELFTADTGNNGRYMNTSYTTIKTADGNATKYTDENLFEVVYKTTKKHDLYLRMFKDNAMFSNSAYMYDLCKVKTLVGGRFDIPLIARMGLLSRNPEMLTGPAYDYLKQVVDDSGYSLSTVEFGNRDWMHLYEVKKEYNNANLEKEYYYLAPTNVGITYLDPNLLQTAFATNMDVLMRAKYAQTGDVSVGVGIPDVVFAGGEDYVLSEDLQKFAIQNNIINNGHFAYVKGERSTSVGVGYTGGVNANHENVVPTISYKVVDVCDPNNETLIRMAVSEIAGPSDPEHYKAWLETQGIDTKKSHYCVVAKITFYADIIVPYSTPLSRNLYSLYRRGAGTTNELFQVEIDSKTLLEHGAPDFYNTDKNMISDVTGNPYYTYTTYVAIMP